MVRALAMVALLLSASLFATACSNGATGDVEPPSPGATATAPRDPSSRGQYDVGVISATFTRTSSGGDARELQTFIWYPALSEDGGADAPHAEPDRTGAPYPVVMFSHGSGGEPTSQRFLTEHLASWGYVVVAPPHPGNTSRDCVICGFDSILPSARERPNDLTAALDGVLAIADGPLAGLADPQRTVVAGHSFGGWTAVYAAADGRYDAAISLAPGLPATLLQRAKRVTVPVLVIASGRDEVVRLPDADSMFDALASDTKTYVTLPEGRHLTFVDRCLGCAGALTEERGHELVRRYVTAFLQARIAGDARYERWLTPDPPDALVR